MASPFVDRINKIGPDRPALYCDKEGRWISYGDLAAQVGVAAKAFALPKKSLAFLLFSNTRADVVAYLGVLAAGHVPALVDPTLEPEMLSCLVDLYRPELLVGAASRPGPGWYPVIGAPTMAWGSPLAEQSEIHPDLGLLLSTSGSTGSPKLVRLGTAAVTHNARAIIRALFIGEADRALAHLPLHYSYGLSILHTHLMAGASVVLTAKSMVEAEFWDLVRTEGCTSLPGTPFHYRIVDRLGLDRLDVPRLMVLTQAGGRLGPELALAMHSVMAARGGRFHVMYGQTEASPRATVLGNDQLRSHPSSVGRPLADGVIRIVDENGRPLPARAPGQVVYSGPNVMMGYALDRADLAKPDEMKGELRTGDLGYVDEAGFLYLTGRANRFAKITGIRVNLDEVEKLAGVKTRLAAVESQNGITLFVEHLSDLQVKELRRDLGKRLRITSNALIVRSIDVLPVTPKGKVDYARLKSMA